MKRCNSCWTCISSPGLMEPLHSSSFFRHIATVCSHSTQEPTLQLLPPVRICNVAAIYNMMRRCSTVQLVSSLFSSHWRRRCQWKFTVLLICSNVTASHYFFFFLLYLNRRSVSQLLCFCPVMCFCSLSISWLKVFSPVIRMPASSTASFRPFTTLRAVKLLSFSPFPHAGAIANMCNLCLYL